jgi:Concanavalin A-like lectin/glucanases superfamily/Chitobiase/beta-hexosaminidase C-terminal domain/Immunoglobulin domain
MKNAVSKFTWSCLFILLLGAEVKAQNLIHQWTFDDGTVNDYVGNLSGSPVGTASISPLGQLVLNGGSDGASYAFLGMNLFPTNLPGITLMTWFNVSPSTANLSRLFDLGSDTANYLTFQPNNGGLGNLELKTGGNSSAIACPRGYYDGSNHVLAVSMSKTDGVNGYGVIRLYIDGAFIGSRDMTATSNYRLLPIGPNNWVGRSESANPSLTGQMDELRIYGEVLSGDTITNSSLSPKIVVPPANQSVVAGGTSSFRVSVAGGTPFNYQWQLNGSAIAGATNSTYTLTGVAPANAGNYSVTVSNSIGSVTSPAAILSVPTSADQALIHQWTFNDGTLNDYIGNCNGRLAGTAYLSVSGQLMMIGGTAYPILTTGPLPNGLPGMTIMAWFNASSSTPTLARLFDFGSDTSNFLDFVLFGGNAWVQLMTAGSSITITCPTNYVDNRNHSLAISLSGTGGTNGFGTIYVYIDGALVGNADMSGLCNYTLLPSGPNNWFGGSQSGNTAPTASLDEFRVYNIPLDSIAISNIVAAGLPAPPTITGQPAPQTVGVGAEAWFSATVIGASPISYQWLFNGTPVDGATNSSCVLTNVGFVNAGSYSLLASNVFGTATSRTATLTVQAGPPANDNLLSATALNPAWTPGQLDTQVGVTVIRPAWTQNGTAVITGASTEPGEPTTGYSNASIWYSYTAPQVLSPGELRIIATNAPSSIVVYSGGSDAYYFPFEGFPSTTYGVLPNVGGNPTYTNAAASGEGNQSIVFNGTSDYLEEVEGLANQPTAYTISVWVRVHTVRASTIVARTTCNVGGGGCATMSHMLRINSAGKFEHYTSDGVGRTVTGTTTIQPNVWYHVCAVAQNNGTARLYVNGSEEGTASNVNNLWTIGDRWVVAGNFAGFTYFDGNMDRLAIMRKVLAPDQVAAVAAGKSVSNYVSATIYPQNLITVASSINGTLSASLTPGCTYQIAFACPGSYVYDYPFNFYFFPPPANDFYTNCVVIPNTLVASNIVMGGAIVPIPMCVFDTSGATSYGTAESGEQGGGGNTVKRSVWFKFTPVSNGWFKITTTTSTSSYLDIGQGSPTSFTNVTLSTMAPNPSVSRKLIGGQDYYIRVWSPTSANPDNAFFSLHMIYYPEPGNNNWTNRFALPLTNVAVIFNLTNNATLTINAQTNFMGVDAYGADRETGETLANAGNSVWYGWTPSSSGLMAMTASNISSGLTFRLTTGAAVNALTSVAGTDNGSTHASVSWTYQATAGTNYTLDVANWLGQWEDSIMVSGIFYPSAVNDMFSNRTAISVSGTIVTNYLMWNGAQQVLSVDEVNTFPGYTWGATAEASEPNIGNGWSRSLWWSWTSSRADTVYINTYGSLQGDRVSQLDTVLNICTGTLPGSQTVIGSADDTIGKWAGVSIVPTPGTYYNIQVWDKNGGGAVALTVDQPIRPANDNFTNAAVLNLARASLADGSVNETDRTYGTIANAGYDTGETWTAPSVWYKWTPDISGNANMTMDSSWLTGVFVVYTGNAVSSLVQVAASATGFDGKQGANFNAAAGTTYLVQIRATSGKAGVFYLATALKSINNGLVGNNDYLTNGFVINPDSLDFPFNRVTGAAAGSTTNATLEPGETNAFTALLNAGVELNDNYPTNVIGTNSIWWSYTAKANRTLALYNSSMVAAVALRTGLPYDPAMNLVNPLNPLLENIVLSTQPGGTWFTNASSATSFSTRPSTNATFRVEMFYTYSQSMGGTYNTILLTPNASFSPLVIRNSDQMLGTYNNGTFVSFGATLSSGQECQIALECAGSGTTNSAYILWVNRALAGSVISGFDSATYYITGIGAAGGRIRDLHIYKTVPVSHFAIEAWQAGNLVGIDDDLLVINCLSNATYNIRTTPLSAAPADLAMGKNPVQSSDANAATTATNAVDGNPGTFSSTGNEASPAPWWSVDLGAVSPITTVELWNRLDVLQSQTYNTLLVISTNALPLPASVVVGNSGFETPVVGAGNFVYGPASASWTFSGAGISGNASGFSAGNGPAPAGSQVAFLQTTGYFSQNVNLVAGSYNVNFLAAKRVNSGGANDFNILIDGTVVGYFKPTNGTYSAFTTTNFTVATGGSHLLKFLGLNSAGGDNTTMLDSVSVSPAIPYDPNAISNTVGAVTFSIPGTLGRPSIVNSNIMGRYVFIQLASGSASNFLQLSSVKVNSTLIPAQSISLAIQEYYPARPNNAPYSYLDLSPTNQTLSWTLPNGTATAATYINSDSSYFAYNSFYSGEQNPFGNVASIWYKVVAPASGPLSMANVGGSSSEFFGVTAAPNTSSYLGSANGSYSYNVTLGSTYYVQVIPSALGFYNVTLQLLVPVANDNWANATTLNFITNPVVTQTPDGPVTTTTLTANVASHNWNATKEAGEITIDSRTGQGICNHSVWWKFVAPTNGYVYMEATNSTFITQIAIKPDSSGVAGNWGTATYALNGAVNSFYCTAGTTYRICVDGTSLDAGMGGINLNVTFIPVPPNDNWAAATQVPLVASLISSNLPNGTASYTNYLAAVASQNIAATYEASEYTLNNNSSLGIPGRSVWFSINPGLSGYLRLDTTKSLIPMQNGIKLASTGITGGWAAGAWSAGVIPAYFVTAGTPYMICVDGTGVAPGGQGLINLDLSLVASPQNDSWSNATTIAFTTNYATYALPNGVASNTIYRAGVVGCNMAGTYENGAGENAIGVTSSQGIPGRSIWWKFVAPASGYINITATNSSIRTQVGIKPASAGLAGGWNGSAAWGIGSITNIGITAGTTYYICIDGTSSDAGQGFINLDVELDQNPPNDVYPGNFVTFTTNGVIETVAEFSITNWNYVAATVGANDYATLDGLLLGDRFTVGSARRNIWWYFIPPANSSIASISLVGSSFDTLLGAGVFTPAANAPYVNDDYNSSFSSVTTGMAVTAGQTNYVEVEGKTATQYGSVGGVNLTITIPQGPGNDFFSNRTVLTPTTWPVTVLGYGNMGGINLRIPGSTTYASSQGENWGPNNNNYLTVAPSRNVWFQYTPTNTGYITLTTESPGSHLLAVYSVGYNGTWVGGSVGTLGANPNATVSFNAPANTAYYICVDGTVPGPFVLNLKNYGSPSPVNDNFANRIALTNGVAAAGTVAGATRESGEPAGQYAGNSVWYKFTPTCSGQVSIDTAGSTADTYLAVYTGGAVNTLTFVSASNDTDGKKTSRVTFSATSGQEYEIAVVANSGAALDFVITPRQTCSGYVDAAPSSGSYWDWVGVFLSTPGGGPIYYSLNGGGYQVYTNGSFLTPNNMYGVNYNNTNGTFTKTTTSTWGNSGFTSDETISGDGFAECVATVNNQDSMFGLDAAYSAANYTDIDFAINLSSIGILRVYEAGNYKADGPTYSIGDRMRVVRSGNTIRYYKNGSWFYTSSPASTKTLHFAAAINQLNASIGPCFLRAAGIANETALVITSGDINGTVTLSAYSQAGSTNNWTYNLQAAQPAVLKGQPIGWANLQNAVQIGSALQASGVVNNSWTALAVSTNNATGNCSADCLTPEFAWQYSFMFGLTTSPLLTGSSGIQYGWYNSGTTLLISEAGTSRGSFGNTSPGDILRVERVGNQINYYQNGALRYVSLTTVTNPLYAGVSCYTANNGIAAASFFKAQSPGITVIGNNYGDSTLYTFTNLPGPAAVVTAASPDAVLQPPAIVLGTTFRFRNFRNGVAPSPDITLNFMATTLLAPIFQVSGTPIYVPAPITVVSPSGAGGLWTITYPSGLLLITNAGSSVQFNPQGGGKYTASLAVNAYQVASSSTNLSFVVGDLTLTPSTSYSTIPFNVFANGTYPLSIYYGFSANVTPNVLYSGPIALGNTNVTIYFMGTRAGWTPQLLNATYSYSPTITITPAGTLYNATTFTISAGQAAGVRYLVPGGDWQTYVNPFIVDGVLGGSGNIMAYLPLGVGNTPTNSTAVTFRVANITATPSPGSIANGPFSVTAATVTTNATIYWGMGDNQGSSPTADDATNLYTEPISLSDSRTLIFIGSKANYISTTNTAAYVMPVATPVFVTGSNTFSGPSQIVVASSDGLGGSFILGSPLGGNQTITTNGTTAVFTINAGGTYTLTMARNGWNNSPPTTRTFNFITTDLGFSPTNSCFYNATVVAITLDNSNPSTPTVFYTLDGSLATTNSTRYTGTFTVSQTTTIIALAARTGYQNAYATNLFTYLSPMSISPGAGTYNNAQTITLSNAQASAIYFRTNGSDWQIYTGPFLLDGMGDGNVALTVRYDSSTCSGPTNLSSYLFQVPNPIITPGSTNFIGTLNITATDVASGASIYYAIGDTNGGASAGLPITNLYTGPLAINSTRQITFQAVQSGYQSSSPVDQTYVSTLGTPWFVTSSGTFTNPATITVASPYSMLQTFVLTSPSGVATTNTLNSRTANFTADETGSYTVQLFKSPWLASDKATNNYSFQVADLTVTPASQAFNGSLTVTAAGGAYPKPLAIYYSTNGSLPGVTENLVQNPGNDMATSTNVIPFWTPITGAWTQRGADPTPQAGSAYFFAGQTAAGELDQDVDLTAYADMIDTGASRAQFTGSVNSYGDGDQSRIIVEYRDNANSTVLSSYDSGNSSQSPQWRQLSDIRVVPSGTRYARIRLLATRQSGISCDGYFDSMGLTLTSAATLPYSGPITLTNTTTMRFVGVRQGYASQYIDRQYDYAAGCSVSPGTSTNTHAITVTITPDNNSSTVYYRRDGGAWAVYSGPLAEDGNGNGTLQLEVYAQTGTACSATNSYIYTFQVAPLDVAPPSGNLDGAIEVTASTATPGASIYYAADQSGNPPSLNLATNLYAAPLTVSNTVCLLFQGTKTGYRSVQTNLVYSGKLPTPTILTPTAEFTNMTAIQVQSGLPGTSMDWVIISPSGVTNRSRGGFFGSVDWFNANAVQGDQLVWNINETGTFQFKNTHTNWQDSEYATQTYSFVVKDLVVTPSGIFTSNYTLTAQSSSSSNPKPLLIYYSTNGVIPDTNSSQYSAPLTFSGSTTVIWLGTRSGYTSEVITNHYQYTPPLYFSPGAGTYSNAIVATLSTPAPGATYFWSLDGSNWSVFTNGLTLDGLNNGTGTFWAAYTNAADGLTNSYPLNFVAAAPIVDPTNLTLSGPLTVTAATSTTGATINYSLSHAGVDPDPPALTYVTPLTITNRSFLVFRANKAGYQGSINVIRKYIEKLSPPTFGSSGEPFSKQMTITVQEQRPASDLSFHIDGPTGNSVLGTYGVNAQGWPYAAFTVNQSADYSCWVSGPDWEDSDKATNHFAFVVLDLVTTPTLTFNTETTTVQAASQTPNNTTPLVIFYTMDGSLPTTNSAQYSGPLTLSNTTMIVWLGARFGYTSQVVTNIYTHAQAITAAPASGMYSNAVDITLTSQPGAQIIYSTDGTNWTAYSGPIHFDGFGTGSLSLLATYPGETATNQFDYLFKVASPTATPGGNFVGQTTVYVTNSTVGSDTVCYEAWLSGDSFSGNGLIFSYTAPFVINWSSMLTLEGHKTGYQDADSVRLWFKGVMAPPHIMTAEGVFSNLVNLTVIGAQDGWGTFIMQDPSGNTMSLSSASVVRFPVNASGTYHVWMAASLNWGQSPATNWTARFIVNDLKVKPAGGQVNDATRIVISTGTTVNPKPLVVFYTTDGSMPTVNSTRYSQPVQLSNDTTIIWLATREGYEPELQTNSYHYVPSPQISPTNGPFFNATMFSFTYGGSLWYRTNYSDWVQYSAPFLVDGHTTIDYYGVIGNENCGTNSAIAQFQIAPLSVSPESQITTTSQTITALSDTAGVQVFYQFGDQDGGAPDVGSPSPYSQPLHYDGLTSRTYELWATKSGYTRSDTVTRTFTVRISPPSSLLGTQVEINKPTINTLTNAASVTWNVNGPGEFKTLGVGMAISETYTTAGDYTYTLSRPGWADSLPFTVSVNLAISGSSGAAPTLTLTQMGLNYDNGRQPDSYSALGITGGTGSSSWYKWTAPANGLANIKLSIPGAVSLYLQTTNGLQVLTTNSLLQELTVNSNQTYYLEIH